MRKFLTLADRFLMRIPSVALAIVFATSLSFIAGTGCTIMTEGQKNVFDQACQAVTAAYAVYSSEGTPSSKIETAWTIAERTCKNPPTNIAAATTQVLLAAYAINKARNDG